MSNELENQALYNPRQSVMSNGKVVQKKEKGRSLDSSAQMTCLYPGQSKLDL